MATSTVIEGDGDQIRVSQTEQWSKIGESQRKVLQKLVVMEAQWRYNAGLQQMSTLILMQEKSLRLKKARKTSDIEKE